MFMREAVARTMADRMAWFWMLAEPIAMVLIMIAVRTIAMGKGKIVPGAEFVPWLVVGLFGFTLFRENMMRALGAVSANNSLFAYRQIKPVDTVLVRCYLEGMLKSFIFLVFIFGGILLEIDMLPADPLMALFAWFSLWMLGAGLGLTFSVLSSLIAEVERVVKITTTPLLLISGVIFPLNFIPQNLLPYVLVNPIVHGIEVLRSAFFPAYRLLPGVDLLYLWFWALAFITTGLLLHIRFEARVKVK
ncbi:ABC transporter permease [Amphritea balenae]|nr:ABC transporter permease [Amphritea balenae]GGK58183.1 transport permease protein [Amphritea balenae]